MVISLTVVFCADNLIAGNVDTSFPNLGSITPHVKPGKIKLLAVTAEKRARDAGDREAADAIGRRIRLVGGEEKAR